MENPTYTFRELNLANLVLQLVCDEMDFPREKKIAFFVTLILTEGNFLTLVFYLSA